MHLYVFYKVFVLALFLFLQSTRRKKNFLDLLFKKMMTNPMKEASNCRVEVTEFSAEIMETIIKFMYTNLTKAAKCCEQEIFTSVETMENYKVVKKIQYFKKIFQYFEDIR